MVKVINILGDEYSGAVGQSAVFSKWKGIQYRRKWVRPANPRSSKQVAVRTNFENAVIKWHAYNSLQRGAYNVLARGEALSGFNLLVKRWQLNTDTTRTIPPKYGMKRMGSASSFQNDIAVGAVTTKSLGLTSGHVLAMDDATPSSTVLGALMNGTTALGCKGFVDIQMGQVRIVTAPTNKYWISYKYSGNQITGEELGTGTGTKYTKKFPIDAESVHIYDEATFAGASEVQFAEVDTEATSTGINIRATNGVAFAAGSTVKYSDITVLADVKMKVDKQDSPKLAFQGYSDAKGAIKIGLTVHDENYDVEYTKTGYTTIAQDARSALLASKNETIVMPAA